jgi:hypothetical protein
VQSKFKKFNVYIGAGTTILAILSLIGLFVVISDYRDQTSCQAQYNKSYSQALVERQNAANDDRAATRTLAEGTVAMLDVILNPASSTDQRRKSIEDYRKVYQNYLTASQDADKKRTNNPLPGIPECAVQ